jgi:hypothetical protein
MFPDDIVSVVTQPDQFAGYKPGNPVREDLLITARDVMCRWYAEKRGVQDVGRILPREYLWFRGDGYHNYFRDTFEILPETHYWDWSIPDPYTR